MGEPVCVEVELEVVDPIKGRVREPGEPERPFLGWLQLLETLEAVCSRVRGREAGSSTRPSREAIKGSE